MQIFYVLSSAILCLFNKQALEKSSTQQYCQLVVCCILLILLLNQLYFKNCGRNPSKYNPLQCCNTESFNADLILLSLFKIFLNYLLCKYFHRLLNTIQISVLQFSFDFKSHKTFGTKQFSQSICTLINHFLKRCHVSKCIFLKLP